MVSDQDTAAALGSGDVPVLATPRLIALCERACLAAIVGRFPPEQTTVGMRVQVDHMQPTGIGSEVVAEAVLEKTEGRRLMFHVSASDRAGLIATGRITRVVVDRDRFLEKVCSPET